MGIRLAASAISGIAVSLCSLPFDNVKTKVLKMKKSNFVLIKMRLDNFLIKDFSIVSQKASRMKVYWVYGLDFQPFIREWPHTL